MRGGARKGAGRKPAAVKRTSKSFYISTLAVEKAAVLKEYGIDPHRIVESALLDAAARYHL